MILLGLVILAAACLFASDIAAICGGFILLAGVIVHVCEWIAGEPADEFDEPWTTPRGRL